MKIFLAIHMFLSFFGVFWIISQGSCVPYRCVDIVLLLFLFLNLDVLFFIYQADRNLLLYNFIFQARDVVVQDEFF